MIDRRQLLALGGMLGGVAARGEAAEGVASGVGEMTDRTAQDMVAALRNITAAMYAAQSFDAIDPIRVRQNDYLKATNKFPDFIDVSVDVWTAVYDWHIRMQQPLAVGRDINGRYTMMLGFTQLVLRPDVAPKFISTPYDAR